MTEEKVKLFIDQLVQDKKLSEEHGNECLRRMRGGWYEPLEYLFSDQLIPSDDLGKLWGDFIGMSYVNITKSIVDPSLKNLLPDNFCQKHHCVPLYEFGGAITLAMYDPFNIKTISLAKDHTQKHISPVFSFRSEIDQAVAINSLSAESLSELVSELEESVASQINQEDDTQQSKMQLPDIVKLIDALLLWSKRDRASDIHIEPTEFSIRVRFRIDGMLQERAVLDKRLHQAITNRLKIVAKMDITEKRRPQDGNIKVKIRNITLEYRFSSIPNIYGERLVLRSLTETESKTLPGVEKLGLSLANETILKDIIKNPHGIFLVTGPTGSGKSTTLFSILQEINEPEVNIMTVEDPIERRINGISQSQVDRKKDVNFATLLRSFLRQDPDIMLIGEIRDLETAKIATEAALTGHLVFASLHTNDAIQAVNRLIDIGVEPYLVAPSLIGVLSQRLVRRLCPACKQEYRPDKDLLDKFFTNYEGADISFYKATGCSSCENTGYQGRLAVHELLNIDNEMRSMISRNAKVHELSAHIEKTKFKTILFDGLMKAVKGDTSIEEILRVISI